MFDEQPIAAGAVGGDGEDAQGQMFRDGLFSGGEVFAFGASHPRSAAFTPQKQPHGIAASSTSPAPFVFPAPAAARPRS